MRLLSHIATPASCVQWSNQFFSNSLYFGNYFNYKANLTLFLILKPRYPNVTFSKWQFNRQKVTESLNMDELQKISLKTCYRDPCSKMHLDLFAEHTNPFFASQRAQAAWAVLISTVRTEISELWITFWNWGSALRQNDTWKPYLRILKNALRIVYRYVCTYVFAKRWPRVWHRLNSTRIRRVKR